jgi:exopolysaccharide biosynthesis polyprenyl glycosylphosphotransferase
MVVFEREVQDRDVQRSPRTPRRSAITSWPSADVLRRRLLFGADVVAVLCATMATGTVSGSALERATATTIVALCAVGFAKTLRLYDRDHQSMRHTTAEEVPTLLSWTLLIVAVAVIATRIVGGGEPSVLTLSALVVALLGGSTGLRAAARAAWRRSTPPERTVIVGTGPLERGVRRKLELFPDMHLEVVAVVDTTAASDAEGLLASIEETAGGQVQRIVIASTAIDEWLIRELVPACRARGTKLGMVPPARGMFGTAVRLDHIAELPVIQYNTWHVSRSTAVAKRAIDILIAVVGLLLVSPLLAAIALAIRLDSRGPAIFRQPRGGREGKPFTLLKFRTMVHGADQRVGEVIDVAALATPMFKLHDDPRVTRVGRFLRKTSLDELPQFWNVLRGDMSLVGPRPEQLDLVARYDAEARAVRLVVRPGLTGPMQVYGRGRLDFEERLAVEREYVENLSLGRDARLLALSVAAVVRGTGAY